MYRPLVSVIVPAYNLGDYIGYALDSVLEQRYESLEVLVVDDGSTDQTRSVVSRYERHGVTYIWQPNSGFPSAHERGVSEANGEYVTFLDPDDWWIGRDKIQHQVDTLQANTRAVLSYTDYSIADENGHTICDRAVMERFGYMPHGSVVDELLLGDFIPFGSILVTRRAMDTIGGFEAAIPYMKDYPLLLKLSTVGEFEPVDYPGIVYRKRADSMSADRLRMAEQRVRAYAAFLMYAPDWIGRRSFRIGLSAGLVEWARALHEGGASKPEVLERVSAAIAVRPSNLKALLFRCGIRTLNVDLVSIAHQIRMRLG